MGMFDYVRSEIPLPDGWNGELQSKDFDCAMTTVVIRADGRLQIERFETEMVPPEEREHPDPSHPHHFMGCLRRVNRRWVDLNFHGDFYFGGLEDLKDDYWVPVAKRSDGGFWQKRYRDHDYVARFSNGNLDWIREESPAHDPSQP